MRRKVTGSEEAMVRDDSQVAIRADETAAALQRLKWELERAQQKRQAAG